MQITRETWALLSAGGKGERLWPLSRIQHPKQLLKIGSKTILEDSIERLSDCVEKTNIVVVGTQEQQSAIQEITDRLNVKLISEPCARNTAAACLFGIDYIAQKNSNATLLFVPADHVIGDTQGYIQTLKAAIAEASAHKAITLLGITPRSAHTGYGYIQYDQINRSENGGHALLKFHEKPNQEVAHWYAQAPDMLWNSGIVAAPLVVLKEAFQTAAPALVYSFEQFKNGALPYNQLDSISLDYAVLEKTKNIRVLPASWQWHDVGDLQSFITLQHQKQNYTQATVTIDAGNNVVHVPNKLVALVGVSNLCVVETNDVLCITSLDCTADVKKVVQHLKIKNLEEYI